jgi:transposase InsO family protein
MLAAQHLRRGERKRLAALFGVSVRTLWNWEHAAPAARRGRPRQDAAVRRRAFRTVARAWCAAGRGAGWRTVCARLGGRVSERLVQESLRVIKQMARSHTARRTRRTRVTTTVHARDAVWHLDATFLGRDGAGGAVEAQVLLDAASRRTLAAQAGPPAAAEEVVALLERVHAERGTLPLVLATDNGSAYVNDRVAACLAAHRVVHLRNLPHTPQHNGRLERRNGEIKTETGLGRGVELTARPDWRGELEAAVTRLDHHRPRRCLSWRTSAAAEADLTPWYNGVSRDRVWEDVCRRVSIAVQETRTRRARRVAEREAIHCVLEEHGLITRTRGGAPLRPEKAESVL